LHIEKLSGGSEEFVETPEAKCIKGEFAGDIHTHCEEKGISNVDVFQEVQWNLNKERPTPRLACVTYPMYDKKNKLFKMGIECDCIKDFGEKEIQEIPSPLVIKGVHQPRENMEFLKKGSARAVGSEGGWGGMIATSAFVADMNNIRRNLKEKGFIETSNKEIVESVKLNLKNSSVIMDMVDEVKLGC